MKKTIITLLALTLTSSLFAAVPPVQKKGPDANILPLVDKALAEAKKSDKNVMLTLSPMFWGKKINSDIQKSSEFKKYTNDNLVVVILDRGFRPEQADLFVSLSRKYKVRFYPTILVLDSEGKELMRITDRNLISDKTLKSLKKLDKKDEEKPKVEKKEAK